MTFGAAAPAASEGTIAPEGGCPGKFFTSRKWTFDQGGLTIRDHNGQPLAQLSDAGRRFEGKCDRRAGTLRADPRIDRASHPFPKSISPSHGRDLLRGHPGKPMPEYQLYCFAQSGNAYRAALMLNLIGADWKPVYVDFFKGGETRTPKYRAEVNEMGEVPVLVHGDKKLTQSGVILTYLAERSGKFKPEGEDERLEALRWIIFDNQKVNGFLGPYRFLQELRASRAGDPAVMAFLKGRIDGNLAIVDKRLAGPPVHARRAADHRRHLALRLSLLSGRGVRLRHRRPRTRTSAPGSSASRRCRAGSILTT